MFLTLLVVTFLVAASCTALVGWLFRKPIARILHRIIAEELSKAWQRYVAFAIFVVGISGGVRIWDLEKYITPHGKDDPMVLLNAERWLLEVYRTVIETLQSVALMLLAFFAVTLVAFVVVRGIELKHGRSAPGEGGPAAGNAA